MLNFAGQDIRKGDYIGQVARTNQGMKRRVGVVTGDSVITYRGEDSPGLRVIWNDFDGETWTLEDGNVLADNVFHIDPKTLGITVQHALAMAVYRGHA